jgi:RNA polymerase sigma factor (sigma-70 family)
MDQILHIVEGCYKHDRQSQRSLYDRYYGCFLRVVFRYIDSYEESVRLTDAAFLVVFRDFSYFSLTDESKVGFYLTEWIKKIMIAAIIWHIKPKINLYEHDRLPNPYRKDLHLSLPETPALYAELIATIRELPAGFRAVFNLHIIERYPLAEIAEMLGISEQTTLFYFQAAQQYCIGPLSADRHVQK